MRDLNDLLLFAEVVDRRGFAAAGRALGLPRSRLSRRVAELEARLGARLLQRNTRNLSLTQAGQLYYSHCCAVRDAAAAADDAIAQIQREPRGTVRVACPVILAQSVIGDLTAQFLACFPLVKVDLQVSNRMVDPVEEGVDIALRVRSTPESSCNLVIKPLCQASNVLVCTPELLRGRAPLQGVKDLKSIDFLCKRVDERNGLRLIGPEGQDHLVQLPSRLISDDLVTLRSAVIQGLGMCAMPKHLCIELLAVGKLVEVLPGWAPPAGVVYAVFASRRGLIPAVRCFLDFLDERL